MSNHHDTDNRSTLTVRQEEILTFMRSNERRQPTVREIAKHFAISPTTAQGHVEALRKKGAIGPR